MQEFNEDIKVNNNINATGDLTAGGKITGQSLSDALINETVLTAYPIGAVYTSTSATSPAQMWGGTWERLSQDAYFKIVTSNAGQTGGTSANHTIPLSSTAVHNHEVLITTYSNAGTGSDQNIIIGGNTGASGMGYVNNTLPRATRQTDDQGGGQPYYPFYYGVYAWVRTA